MQPCRGIAFKHRTSYSPTEHHEPRHPSRPRNAACHRQLVPHGPGRRRGRASRRTVKATSRDNSPNQAADASPRDRLLTVRDGERTHDTDELACCIAHGSWLHIGPNRATVCTTQPEVERSVATSSLGVKELPCRISVFRKYVVERVFAEQIRNLGSQHLGHAFIREHGRTLRVDDPKAVCRCICRINCHCSHATRIAALRNLSTRYPLSLRHPWALQARI